MAWTRYQILLACLMIVTGSINTLCAKWSDEIHSEGVDGVVKNFNHPFFQANCMFLGECFCFIVFKILYAVYKSRGDGSEDVKELTKGNRQFNPFILYIPAICDMSGTSLMYIGLNLTFASSYQMFRGSVIIFVGLLSMCFLKRKLGWMEWTGILCVMAGLSIVGVADFVSKKPKADEHSTMDIIIGDLLIVVAQILTSIQFVVEEKFVSGKAQDIPSLQAVGWEGIFGFCTIALLQIPFYFIRAGPPVTREPGDRLEDAIDAFVQIGNSWQLALSVSLTIISIAFFNFAGISVTKEMSATTRMVLDSVRTIIIWIVSLSFLGQVFHYLQLIGFMILILGMCLYNHITCTCCCRKKKPPEEPVEPPPTPA